MKEKLQLIKDFLFSPTHSRTLGVLLVLILIVGTIVTVQVLPQQTNTQQHAASIGGGGSTSVTTCSTIVTNGVKAQCAAAEKCANIYSGTTECPTNYGNICCLKLAPCHDYTEYSTCVGQQVCDLHKNTCTKGTNPSTSNCHYQDGACGYTAPPTPKEIYPDANNNDNKQITCGPTNNGTCWWYNTKAFLIGDPNSYTNNYFSINRNAHQDAFSALPSCSTITHTSGATESTVNENNCVGQGGGWAGYARCCIPGKPITPTPTSSSTTTVKHFACVADYGTATYPSQGSNQLKDADTGKAISGMYCPSNAYCHVASGSYANDSSSLCHTGNPPTTASLPSQVCTCGNAGNPASGQNGFTCVYPSSSGKAPLNIYCSNGIACNQVDKNTILCGNKGYGASNKTCAHPYIAPNTPQGFPQSNAIYQDGKIVEYCPSADDYCYNDANGVPKCANRLIKQTINLCQFPGNSNDGMNVIAASTYISTTNGLWVTDLSYCPHGDYCTNVNGKGVCHSGATSAPSTSTASTTGSSGSSSSGGSAGTSNIPNVCTDKPAQTNLVLSPVCSSGKISEVKANFPAASGSTGYILDWWFHRSVSGKDEYNECAKAFTANGTAVGSYSNNAGGANRELGTTCFDSNATSFGAAYRIETKACTGPSSNPATYIPMTVCQTTTVTLNVKMPGIGTAQFENNSPAHQTRSNVGVVIFDQSGNASTRTTTTLTYNSSTGLFVSSPINVGVLPYTTAKEFRVYLGVPQFLKAFGRKDSSKGSIISLTPGVANTVTVYPQPGDIANDSGQLQQDDVIDVFDYNVIKECHENNLTTVQMKSGNSTVTVNCSDVINFLDYPDGGVTQDEFAANYNAWLRSNIAACSANSKCTGD